MTAVEMLALYGSGAAEEKNLWKLALRILPRGMRRNAAGRTETGQNAAALLPEVNFARAVRTQEGGFLPGEQLREGGAESPVARFLRAEEMAVSAAEGLVSRMGEPGGTEGFLAGNPFAEGAAGGAYAGKSGGARLRESVLGAERAALSRGEALRGNADGFGSMYAEFERRLAIELGAG